MNRKRMSAIGVGTVVLGVFVGVFVVLGDVLGQPVDLVLVAADQFPKGLSIARLGFGHHGGLVDTGWRCGERSHGEALFPLYQRGGLVR